MTSRRGTNAVTLVNTEVTSGPADDAVEQFRLSGHRMMRFAQFFPRNEIYASLMRELSWTHFLQPLPPESGEARRHYTQTAAMERWSDGAFANCASPDWIPYPST